MAIWRGRTTLAVRRADRISPRLYIEMARDQFLDVLDLDLFRVRSPHQIANGELGGLHSELMTGSFNKRIQPDAENVASGVYVAVVFRSAIVAGPHPLRQVCDTFRPRRRETPALRTDLGRERLETSSVLPPFLMDLYESMRLKSDHPASSTLFAMVV